MTEEQEKIVGLKQLDDEELARIVQIALEEGGNDMHTSPSPGYIAFMELAKRSGWDNIC